jgi:hypothetical protein
VVVVMIRECVSVVGRMFGDASASGGHVMGEK